MEFCGPAASLRSGRRAVPRARVWLLALLVLAAAACAQTEPAPDQEGTTTVTNMQVLLPDSRPHSTANIRVADLLGNGAPQILVAEAMRGQVVWMRAIDDPVVLADGLNEPVRTHVVDIDGDGDRDILVADIGSFFQTDDKVGRVVLLRNIGDYKFEPTVLLEGVGRVTCAEGADLDGDGDMDIAVCVFGHTVGKVLWLEQKPGLIFEEHVLDARPGAIHAFPFDADGDLDLAVPLSQTSEEVLLFRNDGGGGFEKEVLFRAPFDYYGLSGIELTDLDRDGDIDILLTNGDTFEPFELPNSVDPNDLHGLAWLENDGSGAFEYHEIIRIWGPYSVRAADLDGDSDLDLVLSTFQVPDFFPRARVQGMVWLENDGAQGFVRHDIEVGLPPLTVALDVADLDGDGLPEIIAGTLDHVGGNAGHRLVIFNLPVSD